MSFLQNHPAVLEVMFDGMEVALRPFRKVLRRGGVTEGFFVLAERIGKGGVFNCQMCGQCVLHYTGMTCPMTCPKNMRNGPCGGVRANEHCEVYPDRLCVWTLGWRRSSRMPKYGTEIHSIQPPVDRRLEGTSSWLNELLGIPDAVPAGWRE